jgi:hypothetical protein
MIFTEEIVKYVIHDIGQVNTPLQAQNFDNLVKRFFDQETELNKFVQSSVQNISLLISQPSNKNINNTLEVALKCIVFDVFLMSLYTEFNLQSDRKVLSAK